MDLDRRVRRGRERLSQEVEPAPPPPLTAEKSEQLSVLEEKIKNLLEQVESLGEAGKVDEAEALMRKVLNTMQYLSSLAFNIDDSLSFHDPNHRNELVKIYLWQI